jgi:simple sugar transport system permease protein
MSEIIDILISASFSAAVIRIASPLILAKMGELICERVGVLNLGIEGIMVIWAFTGWMAVYQGMPLWGGVAVAMGTGMLFGLLHSTLTVPFGLSQHVVGLGVTLFATASASFAYRLMLPEVTIPPKIEPFQPLDIPVLSNLPWYGEAFCQQTALTCAAFAVVGIGAFTVFRAPLGLAVRASGENPAAAEAPGLSVTGLRMGL